MKSFLIGAALGFAFFFGPTIQQYSDSVRALYAVPHKGASK